MDMHVFFFVYYMNHNVDSLGPQISITLVWKRVYIWSVVTRDYLVNTDITAGIP
jgi:hypothetical protein